jgi:hypothetical protein
LSGVKKVSRALPSERLAFSSSPPFKAMTRFRDHSNAYTSNAGAERRIGKTFEFSPERISQVRRKRERKRIT